MASRAEFEITADDNTRGVFGRIKRGLFSLGRDARAAGAGIVGNLRGAIGGIANVFGAGALSAAGIAAFGKNVVETTDNMGKLAAALGVQIEWFSRFRFTTARSGVDFDQFARALAQGRKRISQAADSVDKHNPFGQGETAKALQRLGLSPVLMDRLNGRQQLMEVIGAANQRGIKGGARLDIFGKIFEDEGALAIAKLAEVGVKGLEQLTNSADAALLEISQKDTEAAALLSDTIGTAFTKVYGRLARVVLDSLPGFQSVADVFDKSINPAIDKIGAVLDFYSNTKSVVDDVQGAAFDAVTGKLGEWWDALIDADEKAAKMLGGESSGDVWSTIGDKVSKAFRDIGESTNEMLDQPAFKDGKSLRERLGLDEFVNSMGGTNGRFSGNAGNTPTKVSDPEQLKKTEEMVNELRRIVEFLEANPGGIASKPVLQ